MKTNFVEKFILKHPFKEILVGGKNRKYLVSGKGKIAFLVLPGSGQDLLSCYDLVNEFDRYYKVIVVTYFGFKSLDLFFKYVNSILKTEEIDKIILYGLSVGGFLGQHFVKRFPEKVEKLILSHSATTKSKTLIKRVIIPGKLLHFFLPLIPLSLFKRVLKKNAGRAQSGFNDVKKLWNDFSTKENSQRRQDMYNHVGWSWLTKEYLESIYWLGTEMEKIEKHTFTSDILKMWKGKILIIRTDNDPLAQDDGMFQVYYPNAQVITFRKTGHLTPFIQFEKMIEVIRNFISISD